MAKIAVCIEPFFPDLPYAERLARIRKLGFRHYEFWFLDKRFDGKGLHDERKNLEELAECNARLGLDLHGLRVQPPGRRGGGLPDRQARPRPVSWTAWRGSSSRAASSACAPSSAAPATRSLACGPRRPWKTWSRA